MLHQHVFSQSTIPKDFEGETPKINVNKSRSFLCWMCSTHSWGGALAPRNFTQDVPLDAENFSMERLFGLFSVYLLELRFWSGFLMKMSSCELLIFIMLMFKHK
jgi:hypothetical protein